MKKGISEQGRVRRITANKKEPAGGNRGEGPSRQREQEQLVGLLTARLTERPVPVQQ